MFSDMDVRFDFRIEATCITFKNQNKRSSMEEGYACGQHPEIMQSDAILIQGKSLRSMYNQGARNKKQKTTLHIYSNLKISMK